jgi:hypothetical protein
MLVSLVVLALAAADPPPSEPPAAVAAPPPQAAAASTNTVAPATVQAEPTYGIVEGRHAPKPKMVCFKDPVLGSKIPTKRCMPRDEFMQRQQETRQYINQFQTAVDVPH